jgi:hypothetical protein
MIVFDLECSEGHLFEGWFDGLEAFEQQQAEGLVSCPHCGDKMVRRVMSPVSVKKAVPQAKSKETGIDYHRLAKEIVDYVQSNFEDVGSRFAGEALKMHYGVSEKKNIRGSATSDEEKTLKEEGIEFFKIPLPKDKDEEDKSN